MFIVERTSPNRVDMEVSGKLDKDAMRRALDEFVASTEGVEQGVMLLRVGDFEFPTLGAITVEISRLPELLRAAQRFERAAVIADQGWIRHLAGLEGAIMPGLQIKGFEYGQEAQAEAWLVLRSDAS